MDRRQRQAQRRYAEEGTLEALMADIAARQHQGERFYCNLQNVYSEVTLCPGSDALNRCLFGNLHQDYDLNQSPAEYLTDIDEEDYDAEADITTYRAGDTLLQLCQQWARNRSPNGSAQIEVIDPFTYFGTEASDDRVTVVMTIYDEIVDSDGTSETSLDPISCGYVVTQENHQAITQAFKNLISHYRAQLQHIGYTQPSRPRRQGRREAIRRRRRVHLLRMLKGAIDMRLSMYRQLALLRVGPDSIEI